MQSFVGQKLHSNFRNFFLTQSVVTVTAAETDSHKCEMRQSKPEDRIRCQQPCTETLSSFISGGHVVFSQKKIFFFVYRRAHLTPDPDWKLPVAAIIPVGCNICDGTEEQFNLCNNLSGKSSSDKIAPEAFRWSRKRGLLSINVSCCHNICYFTRIVCFLILVLVWKHQTHCSGGGLSQWFPKRLRPNSLFYILTINAPSTPYTFK